MGGGCRIKSMTDTAEPKPAPPAPAPPAPASPAAVPTEIGGPRGPEPTRYGDWQTKGRVSDF
jgi:hypothetical protein